MENQNTEIPHKAGNLQEIRKICRPMPLSGKELDAFFVETDSARDPFQSTRRHIENVLETGVDSRLLFYGHRGCGKSTELNKLVAELGDRVLPVKFSVYEEMSPVAVRAEDLILVIAERVLQEAVEAKLNLQENIVKPVLDYFTETITTDREYRDFSFEAGGGVSGQDSLLGKLIGLLVKIRGEIKLNVHSEETRVAKLRKRPGDLVAQANHLLHAVNKALPDNRRLLVVVEDLDKLDLKQARELFVTNVSLLAGIRADIIYTIPVFLFHSPEVNAFKAHFDDTVSLPMIKVSEPQKERTPGFEIIRQVILRRIDENMIEPAALDLLIEKTGGVLRHAFEVLHRAATVRGAAIPLPQDHIRYGLKQLQKEFWQQVTLPYDPAPGGPESVDELYERLAEYGRKQRNGEKNSPKADAINQILLKSCALVEYNGEGWFGVHPLVMDNLKALGRIV